MLFFTHRLSPSLDIVVKVALSNAHLAGRPKSLKKEMDWSFMRHVASLHLL